MHDVGSYVEPGEASAADTAAPAAVLAPSRDGQAPRDAAAPQRADAAADAAPPPPKPPSRILRPGMVTTIEPGLYVRPAEGVPERFWHIGIRIEDDAIVTDSGCELTTRAAPVAPEEIEALMRG